jgi:signal peptidase I
LSPAKNAAAVLLVIVLLAGSALFIYTYTRKVTGVSMVPTLEEGDLVVLQPVTANQVAIGDIIVYDPPCSAEGAAVIHRVVNVAANGAGSSFITKGDNNGLTDQAAGIANGPVTQGCIEGKVVFVIPYLEKLSELPYGLNYLLAILIVVFVFYGELRSRRDGKRVEAAQPDAK